jgi:hypothetical protein
MSSKRNDVSRRQFISVAATTAAGSYLSYPGISRVLAEASVDNTTTIPWRDQGVLNLANSPYAKLHSVPVRAVTIEDGFWSKRRKTHVESSIPTMNEQLEQRGRMDNYRRLVGKSDAPQKGPYYSDSDIYKWTEAVGFALQSGDVFSTWETLKNQIPIGINTGLSGIPLWGTDIGGFVPTPEFTAELFVRWFQFGAFCPLFRCHSRAWKLRLPWGWNTGDPGPIEMNDRKTVPDSSQLHDARVEPICRKYLELRYRMLPYLYSAVRESAITGMPIMRALWMHFPDDPKAVACGDQYLWGETFSLLPSTKRGPRLDPCISLQACGLTSGPESNSKEAARLRDLSI